MKNDTVELTEPQMAALMAMPFKYRTNDDGQIVQRPEGYVGTLATWRALNKMGLADINIRGNVATVKSTNVGKRVVKQAAAQKVAA